MSTTNERAPWTGSTVDYDEAVGAYARAQVAAMDAECESEAEREAIRALRAARWRVEEAVRSMIDWSTSRAYHEIRRTTPTPEVR